MSLGRGRALKSQHAMSNTSSRGDVQGDGRQIRSFGGRGPKVKLKLPIASGGIVGSDFCDNSDTHSCHHKRIGTEPKKTVRFSPLAFGGLFFCFPPARDDHRLCSRRQPPPPLLQAALLQFPIV